MNRHAYQPPPRHRVVPLVGLVGERGEGSPPPPITTDDRAIAILREHGPMRGSDLGWQLWGQTTEVPGRGEGSHGHNKFCRSAGKVLRRLERQGKVISWVHGNCHLWGAI